MPTKAQMKRLAKSRKNEIRSVQGSGKLDTIVSPLVLQAVEDMKADQDCETKLTQCETDKNKCQATLNDRNNTSWLRRLRPRSGRVSVLGGKKYRKTKRRKHSRKSKRKRKRSRKR